MAEVPDERWQVDDLTIDVGQQAVTRDGVLITLPQLSFRFLLALVRSAPRVLSADELLEQVWAGVFVNGETVTQRAKLLRDALGDNPKEPRYFSVRRSAGYHLIPVPVSLAAAGTAEELGRTVRRRRAIFGAVALALVSVGGISAVTIWHARWEAAQREDIRVAVIPFDNLSSDPADAYIAQSIPEMVLNRLSSIGGLTVISRDSALGGTAAASSVGDAGRQLNARYVVTGSVQRAGETLRVTCFLIDTANGDRLWSERFDWPVARIYALQDRIAERVTAALETRLVGLDEFRPNPLPTRNTDAYLSYLRGKSLLGRFTVAESDAAAAQFERAVRSDPEFADAMVALFDARMQSASLRMVDLAPVRVRYQPLLDKALRLQPDSGPGLFARAMWSDVPDDTREGLYKRAAELDPSNARGLTAYSEFLDRRSVLSPGDGGSQVQALLDRVLAIDPLSPRARFWAAQRKWNSTPPLQLNRAIAREMELDPDNYWLATFYARRLWLVEGESAKAIVGLERVMASDPQNPRAAQTAIAIYLDLDDPAAARAVAATTPATIASSGFLLAQYDGNWRMAGDNAFARGGYLFPVLQSRNWAAAVRDYALQTRQFDRGAEAIASRYGFLLDRPKTTSAVQANAAVELAHILLAKGDREKGTALLVQTVIWIDSHPVYGLAVHMRIRASAMMLLGEKNQALSDLRASVETGHDIRHWWYVTRRDPVWEPVHDDPRFREIAELFRRSAREQRAKLDALRAEGKVPLRGNGAVV